MDSGDDHGSALAQIPWGRHLDVLPEGALLCDQNHVSKFEMVSVRLLGFKSMSNLAIVMRIHGPARLDSK